MQVSPRKSRKKSVFLEHDNLDAGARQEKAKHDARRSAAGDTA